MYKLAFCIVFFNISFNWGYCQEILKYNSPGAANPILPGYFADPTIVKFGDIYYIYATTDNEMLASGAPTVWYSKDFQNWYNYIMDVPSMNAVELRNFWAPDIIHGNKGKYYLYFGNCQSGCNIYGYVSDTPVGPWKKLYQDDTPVIPNGYPIERYPSLDAQFFRDSDGKIYAYWGTWVHYNQGYAVGILDTLSMSVMRNSKNIPLHQTPSPFEAAYMLKKGKKYILMYSSASCHDETYNVRYSYSDNPYGPFVPGENNPILSTNADQSVHGPGHHSVLKNNDDYYIVYHRHDYPLTRGGLARQVCADSLIFLNDSTIKKVIPSHSGITNFCKPETPLDLAYLAGITASSYYYLKSTEYTYEYKPSFAVDNNNVTMWKASDNSFPQNLTIDLGIKKRVNRVCTQFEFATYYYQYKIEYSVDGKGWNLFADRSENRIPGSPMIDDGNVNARYIKLTILATQKTGLYAAVWNIKVYGTRFDVPLSLINKPSTEGRGVASSRKLLINLSPNECAGTSGFREIVNKGTLGGKFVKHDDVEIRWDSVFKTKYLDFKKGSLILEGIKVPKSLEWNGSFTVAVWVKNPQVNKEDECLFSWCDRYAFGLANSYNALFYNSGNYGAAAHLDYHFDMRYKQVPAENKWHHIVLTFDGVVEKIYVDGILDNSQNMTLSAAVQNAKMIVGASDAGEHYTGYLASLLMYDYALNALEIDELMKQANLFIMK
jgi:beta-xylosidase